VNNLSPLNLTMLSTILRLIEVSFGWHFVHVGRKFIGRNGDEQTRDRIFLGVFGVDDVEGARTSGLGSRDDLGEHGAWGRFYNCFGRNLRIKLNLVKFKFKTFLYFCVVNLFWINCPVIHSESTCPMIRNSESSRCGFFIMPGAGHHYQVVPVLCPYVYGFKVPWNPR
jgi:hypothetical protein